MPKAEARYTITAEDRTQSAFRSVTRKFGDVARTAAKVGAGVAIAGAAGFAKLANDAINGADEVGKLSRELGVSTERLSEMRGVLELVGGDFQQYSTAIRRSNRAIIELEDGSSEMARTFDSIGLSLADLQGLSPEEQFDKITRALEGVSDETTRSARAQEIFGRSASTVLRLVTTGADEVARLRDEQAAFGNTLSSDTTQAAERFNDAIARMGQALRGAVTGVVAENIDEIAAAMEAIVGFIPDVVRGVAAVVRFVGTVGEILGGGAAAAVQAATGNFSGAGAILRDLFSGEGADEVVGEQRQTNDLLRAIARDGLVGKAG